MRKQVQRRARLAAAFVLILLLIEFLDEFIYSAREAAWPLIRDDLGLTYVQIGLLLGLPNFIASFIEPFIGILGDVWKRRALILGGGLFVALGMLLVATSYSFLPLFLAFTLAAPASGAFVNLAQAALMDADPTRHEQNMARWTFAGSAALVAGPLVMGGFVALGPGWRAFFLLTAALALVLVWSARSFSFASSPDASEGEPLTFMQGVRNALRALRRREVQRWLVLLEFSDLLLDVLYGYLALYFVDVVGLSPAQAGVAVAIWTGVGLLGDFLLIPLLERVRGLAYLRLSALLELLLFPAFLLAASLPLKLLLLGLLGMFNAGWYSILKGQLYSSMPGQSGTVLALGNIAGLVGSLIPFGLGLLAQAFGLEVALWLLVSAPLALLIGLPRSQSVGDS